MKKIKSEIKKLKIRNFVILFLAGIINAIGVTLFLAPVHLYDSGFSGTSMLLWQITPDSFSLSLFLIILNIPFFIYGYHKQGLSFTVYSVFAVCSYSAASYILTYVVPYDFSSSSPFAGKDLLLCAVFGGIISGIGSGLTIRCGGAIDGVEVMAVIFAKKIGITVGTFVMVYNVILYAAVGIILQSFILPLYSVITYAAALKVVDFIVEGLDKAKAAMVITTKADEISAALSETFGYGITHIDAKGYYKNSEQTIIYFVVNRFQIARMKSIIEEYDPNAFVTINDISEFMGSDIKIKKRKES
ncbi:MAG: YitT family protein [Eubacterium sp.]|nr:YitT family protein [Eubacterium sp.]